MNKPKILERIEAEIDRGEVAVDEEDVSDAWDAEAWQAMERDLLRPDLQAMVVIHADKKLKRVKIGGKGLAVYGQRVGPWVNGETNWFLKEVENLYSEDLMLLGPLNRGKALNARVLDLVERLRSGEWQAQRLEAVRRRRVVMALSAEATRLPRREWAVVNRYAMAYEKEMELLSADV